MSKQWQFTESSENKQRFEVIIEEGRTVFISEFYIMHTIPTQPVRHTTKYGWIH